MRILFGAVLLVTAAFALPVCAPARILQIADMARIVNLEEPATTPDGRWVALIAIRQNLTTATEVDSLELVDLSSGRVRTLLNGRDVAVPRWSPDGSLLAYLARASNGIAQAYVRRRDGTVRQMTHAAADVIDVAWSPDGRRLAYVAADLPANREALAHHHDYFFAGNNDYTATALTPPDHLWVVSLSDGRERRLTHGTWTIAPTDPGGIFSPQIAWTPDGSHITFTRVEDTFGGNDENSTLWQIPSAGGTPVKLATGHGRFELSPAYGLRASDLFYWYPREGNYLAENALHAFDGSHDELLAPSLDRNVAGSLWYPDGSRVLLCASDRTRVNAWNLDMKSGALERLPLGDLNIVCDPYSSSTFDAGIGASIDHRGGIAFLATDARHARELYYLAPGRTPRRITHFNDFVAGIDVGRMTNFDWKGPNGFDEDGVVTYPPNFDAVRASHPGAKFPVVLLIHGGPGLSNALDFVWEQWPLVQAIASHGYIVFQPNYRGSDNLGNAYMLAIVGDTAQGPGDDIMSGLAELEKQPYVDAQRLAVSGWSYGGLLTTWLIGHSHVWRAAVSGAAVNDETEEYNLSISNVQNRYYLLASPYVGNGAQIYAEQSPITYYKQITTPTLIWGTTLDSTVPIPLSYALYHALTDNHVPVRFLVFPASTHGPGNPVQTADLTRFWLAWLDQHLR